MFVPPYVCSFFFIVFVKDITTTISDKKFIFGCRLTAKKSYRGIENPLFSLYLLFFLAMHALSTVFL